ncbi:hypothetical protein PRIPAC_93579 [Pristionchus pacificus]|uniref:Putative rRNA methyltransferase n=1 Tax=Pristionchus pacificus TaxID=54126 RepID=A0A2A6BB43_PRIPA|nr:hypothetical protein PRIPAC_93579 [Pristionchus pacificus]|eukprot:PDM63102.1 hypothetical protein PRIPAC_50317 [Pristionchus pacificus]
MGKKAKIGKQRRDKYYRLAKETGFRSRAAFKLIQLNKRFEFLQSSKAVVDLCAAPGGWMQVAIQNMPVSSICIGVDLSPIRPIPNCIALQGDITTEKTRQAIKKELQTWEADCVLHDGAPNVGKNWVHDAFMQNTLVLSSLKLTTQILKRGGTFVTKIFRSQDSHCLITTFQKLFKRVHVWKPAASRLESAEIFVVCEKYLKPAKVDPALLDPKCVFLTDNLEPEKPDTTKLLLNKKKEKKAKAEGYAEGAFSMHNVVSATQFIEMPNFMDVLASASKIELDQEMWDKNEKTTDEIRECLKDIRVLAPRELRGLIKWRSQMIDVRNKAMKEAGEDVDDEEEGGEMEVDVDPDEAEDKELAEIDAQIAKADAEEKAALKKKKKRMLKEKAKVLMRRQLKMTHEGDVEDIPDQPDLFSLKRIKKMKDVFALSGENVDSPMMDDDDEEGDYTDGEGLGEGEWETEEGADDSGDESEDDNELIHTEETGMSKEEKTETRTDRWFNKEEMGALLGEDGEDEDELAAVERHLEAKRRRGEKEIHKNTVSFHDEEDAKKKKRKEKKAEEDDGFNTKDGEESKEAASAFEEEEDVSSDEEYQDVAKKRHLTAEQLAIGEQMIHSSKTRKDLEDWGWNRYMNNDEALPDWFVEDEKRHYQKTPPVTKEQMQAYRERLRELNARPIKKVAEAKARKQRRVMMRLSKAKKKAEGIVENDNLEHSEKIKEMKKIYKKATLKEKKEVSYRVITKGKTGTQARPTGQYKNVDARMKKDDKKKKATNKKASWKNMSTKEKKKAQEKKRKHGAQMKAGRTANRRQKRGKPT